jgi:predicted nucleic acid-binding protein
LAAASSQVFLDTAFAYALLNTRDQWHNRAVRWQARLAAESRPLLTTEFVLMEIGDGLAALRFRSLAADVIQRLRSSSLVEVVPASSRLVADAFTLYVRRNDKDWEMTDCSSFVVMRERGLPEALTMDVHFQQAGFHALLLESE